MSATDVAVAVVRAQEAWHKELHAMCQVLTREVGRKETISPEALADLVDGVNQAFGSELYRQLAARRLIK